MTVWEHLPGATSSAMDTNEQENDIPAMVPNPILNPPILRLDSDILWLIFILNADIFSEPDALKNTRLTSQVCRMWHDLILTTSSLWGRLIDLDALSSAGDDWAREVLRRSGSALLWIKSDHSTAIRPGGIFFDILEKHWQRIQRLAIDVSADAIQANPDRWNAFYLPAPHLKTFKVHIDPTIKILPPVPLNAWSNRYLFANNAPVLRAFYATQYRFDLSAGWINQLSSLRIGYPFTLHEVLFTLQRAPNLLYLFIEMLEGIPDTTGPLPHVHLPKINYCVLNTLFETSIALLEHLKLPPSCRLKFFPCTFLAPNITRDFLQFSFKILSTFAQRYFHCHESSELRLTLLHSFDHFGLKEDTGLDRYPSFEVTVHLLQLPSYLRALIFGEFALPAFSKVTELEMKLEEPVPIEGLVPCLSSFSSCKCLRISDEESLRNLRDFHHKIEQQGDASVVILPNLDIIRLELSFLLFRHNFLIGRLGALHQLLKYRVEHGCAVKVLDLRNSQATLAPSLRYLEEIPGLRVLWTDSRSGEDLEYKCGSGHPEKLPVSLASRLANILCSPTFSLLSP